MQWEDDNFRCNSLLHYFYLVAGYKCRSDKCQCSGSSGTKDALPQKYFSCRINCVFHLTAKNPQGRKSLSISGTF